MDKKTRIFFGVLAFAIVVSIILTFNRAFFTRNYDIIPVPEETTE